MHSMVSLQTFPLGAVMIHTQRESFGYSWLERNPGDWITPVDPLSATPPSVQAVQINTLDKTGILTTVLVIDPSGSNMATLKLTVRQYEATHTNYNVSNCTILIFLNRYSDLVVIN